MPTPTTSTPIAARGGVVALARAVASMWALLVGIALLMLGSGLQGSLLGLRASIEGFSTTTVGIVMSSYYLGYLVGSVRAPGLVSSVGHIRVFAAFASVASSTVLLHSLLVAPLGWTLIRIVSGFCVAGLFVVAESWLNEGATNETRGSLLWIYMVVVYGGMGAGQLLLNAADPGGFELFIVTSVLVSIALVPAALSVRSSPTIPRPSTVTLAEVARAAPLGVVGSMLAGTAAGALFGVGVVYAQLAGLDLGQTSLFMLVAILGGAALQWPVGAVLDRIDRRIVIVAVALLAAAACIAGATGPSGAALLVVIGLVGALSMPLYPLANAHTNDYIEPEQRVGAGGRLVLANGLGAVGGPLLASAAMEAGGEAGFFWFLAVVHVLVAAYAAWRITRRRAASDPAHYHPYPARSSVVAPALDPEAWDTDDRPRFDTDEVPAVVVDG